MNRILLLLVAFLPLRSGAGVAASVSIELVPKITVRGENGTVQSLEWSSTLGVGGKWQVLTNVTLGSEALMVVDLAAAASQRFYRVVILSATNFPPHYECTCWHGADPGRCFPNGRSVR